MNLFLEHECKYVVLEPLSDVRRELKSLINTPWYDLAINLSGKVLDDGRFKLHSKFSLGFKIFNVPQNIAIITGRLEEEVQEQTIMHVIVRPNHAVLFVFYFVLAILIYKLGVAAIRFEEEHLILVSALFLFLIFLRSLIFFSMQQLRYRFEKVMLIAPEEET